MKYFNTIFVIVFALVVITMIVTIFSIFSSKLRGKLLNKQVKAIKYMTDYSKDDIQAINENMSSIAINSKKNILNKYGEDLKDISTKEAKIKEEGIKIKTKSIKEGLTSNKKYCKHCGVLIDEDSQYCSKCGKKQ